MTNTVVLLYELGQPAQDVKREEPDDLVLTPTIRRTSSAVSADTDTMNPYNE